MRRPLTAVLLAAALVAAGLGLSACGGDAKTVTGTNAAGQVTTRTVPDVKFAKTKFVLHSGLAIGAFNRWIYRPWRAGAFEQGADGRTAALVKAGLAAAFTVNELRLARNAALSDDRLRGLGDRMTAALDKARQLAPGLADGKVSVSDIAALSAALGTITVLARRLGVDVKERTPPALPGS
jgi:hypothetical protein